MENIVCLNNVKYPIESSELHIVKCDNIFRMYLGVANKKIGGFGFWEVELKSLKLIDELDGKRIHVKPNGELYNDDTLGTNMLGAYEDSDLNYWGGDAGFYYYGEILIDFKRLQDLTYRVHIELTLTDSDEEPEDLKPEDFNIKAHAGLEVVLDEKLPFDD